MTEQEGDRIARMVLDLVRELAAPRLEPTGVRVDPAARKYVEKRAS